MMKTDEDRNVIGVLGGHLCYKFILIFNGRLPKYDFILSQCLYAALDYVIDAHELLSRVMIIAKQLNQFP